MIMMSMRNMECLSLRREKLNQDMQAEVMEQDMVVIVDVLAHMVDMVVAVDMVATALMVVAMEGGMVDMVEVTMERERLDMVAMEVVTVEVMVEAMVEATL